MLGLYLTILIFLCSCSPYREHKKDKSSNIITESYFLDLLGIDFFFTNDTSENPYGSEGSLPPDKEEKPQEKWAYPLLNEYDLPSPKDDRPDPSAPPPPYSEGPPPPYTEKD